MEQGMIKVKEVLDLITANPSTLKKKSILQENLHNEDLKKTLNFLLNPYVISGISNKKIRKQVDKTPTESFRSFFELMEYLAKNNTGTDQDIANASAFLNKQTDEMKEFFIAIITKTLRLGSDAKTVNKVFGNNFIPLWEVQQAYSFKNVKLEGNEWFALTQKLNGVRGTFFKGKILSRQGKEFFGLEHILDDIKSLPHEFSNYVFDGELVRRNSDNLSDNENFRVGTGILSQDDADKTSIVLTIFDALSEAEFENGESKLTYKNRLELLEKLRGIINKQKLTSINIVKVLYSGSDKRQIDFYLEEMTRQGYEGLMLNRDSKYYCKRHNGILKVKQFYTVDLEIVGHQEGTGRLQGKLGAFVVMYKGNKLNVGSGISDELREEYWNVRDELIGRVIEVKYKEESCDKKTGNKSLQFPIFVDLREEGKEVSYS